MTSRFFFWDVLSFQVSLCLVVYAVTGDLEATLVLAAFALFFACFTPRHETSVTGNRLQHDPLPPAQPRKTRRARRA